MKTVVRTGPFIIANALPRVVGGLVAVFYFLFPAYSSATPVSLATRVLTTWQTRDGLPQQTVKAVTQTHDGYIWIATRDGLGRFDGRRFTEFNTANTPGLATDDIAYVAEDADQTLWIVAPSGISTLRDGVFKNVTPASVSWTADAVDCRLDPQRHFWLHANGQFWRGGQNVLRPIYSQQSDVGNVWAVDSAGALWTPSVNGLVRADSTGTKEFAFGGQTSAYSIAACADGTVWVASTDGIRSIKDGVVWKMTSTNTRNPLLGKERENIADVVADGHGDVWVLAAGRMYRIVDNALAPVSDFAGVRVDAVDLNPAGDVVCLYDSGDRVAICVNRTFVCTGRQMGLSGNPLACYRDVQGDIWIGTDSGLDCIRDRACETFGVNSGLGGKRITSALVDLGWHVLVAEDDGSLYRYLGDAQGRFVLMLRSPSPIKSLVETADGVYLCIVDGVVKQIVGNKLADYTPVLGARGSYGRATSLGIGDHGDLWVCGSKSVIDVTHGAVVAYSMTGPWGKGAVATYVDRDNRFWASASGRVFCFDRGNTHVFGVADGIPKVSIDAIFEDSKNNLWFGSRGAGLARFANGRFTMITRRDGLPSNTVSQIVEDDAENLWFGTPKEIFRVKVKELSDFADRQTPFHAYHYGTADGNSGGGCLTDTQLSGLHGWVSSVWFTCQSGMVRARPWQIPSSPCPISFEQRVINGKSVPASETTIDPGAGDASFAFTALDLKDPEHLQFSYRMIGFDDTWVDAGQYRQAFYTNLPPGTYRFDVKCVNVDGGWSSQQSIRFTMLPHFYQTLWFRLLAVMSIAASIFFVARRRIRELQARNEVLQCLHTQLEDQNEELLANQSELEAQNEELSDLQSELEAQNAELIESKTTLEQVNIKLHSLAITDGLTGLTNHRTFQEELQREWSRNVEDGRPLSLLLIDVDHFKRFNDEFGHQAGDQVLVMVGDVLRTTARESDLAARYGGEEFAIILRDTSAAEALTVADRFRRAIEQTGDSLHVVTASIGVSTWTPSMESPAALIEAADVALYASKRRGRNCVTHSEDKVEIVGQAA